MKKIICLILALALCLSFAACGRDSTEPEKGDEGSSETIIKDFETENSLFLLDETSTLKDITFSYPSDWEISVNENGYILNGEDKVLLIISEELPEKLKGYQSVISSLDEIEKLMDENDVKELKRSEQEIIDSFADTVIEELDGKISTREYTKISNCSALKADCILIGRPSRAAIFFSDNYLYMISISPKETDGNISYAEKDLLDDILESVTLTY